MKRKARALFIAVLVFSVVLAVFSCDIVSEKSLVVGLVNPNKGTWNILDGFVEGMVGQGYVEGKNITYIRAKSKETLEADIKAIVEKKPDLIFTVTTPATKMARRATGNTGIPVVFSLHDPVAAGLVESLTHPGGLLTGIQVRGSTPKALEHMLSASPDMKHVFVPVSFDTKAADQSLEDLKAAAGKLDIKVTVAEVSTPEQLMQRLSTMPVDADAIFLVHSIMVSSNVKGIVQKAIELKLPLGAGLGLHDKGVTITYAPEHFHIGGQASRLAVKILRGNRPMDLPVEISEFFLGLNLKTAESSGVEIPQEILELADFIVR